MFEIILKTINEEKAPFYGIILFLQNSKGIRTAWREELRDYRPMSATIILSKICEKILCYN